MTQRRWSEPFSIGLSASPTAAAWIGLAWFLGAASLAAAVFASDTGYVTSGNIVATAAVWLVGAGALAWGGWAWWRYLRRAAHLEVDAAGELRLDGEPVTFAPGSWSTAGYAGLRLRSGSGMRTLFIGPGSAPDGELRRLRRYLRWTERGGA